MLEGKINFLGRCLEKIPGSIIEENPQLLLAQAKLMKDQQKRAEQLWSLHQTYMGSDGGREALYELALLRVRHYQSESDSAKKNDFLAEARKTLTNFVDLYQDSIFTTRVEQILVGLPEVE